MAGLQPPDAQNPRALRLIAADEDPAALRRTAELLEGLGHEVTACTASVEEAVDLIARDEPDAAIVVVHRDIEHALDLIDEIGEALAGPVVALLAGADAEFAHAAAARGLDALASEQTADGLQGAIEVAISRHAERTQLTRTVGQLEHALDRRAVIERAKGILMERHGLSERAAFDLLRGVARGRSLSVVVLAQQVIDGEDIAVDSAAS
ncbi:MAG: response regulator receiver and domain protein [Solirubrobacteraceae bacterium]|nr:response regulator receiver and domain protein [Solirubrobacteraceae bacterium]